MKQKKRKSRGGKRGQRGRGWLASWQALSRLALSRESIATEAGLHSQFCILRKALRKQRWTNQANSRNTFCWTQPIRNYHFNEWSIGNYFLSRLHLFCWVFEIQFVFCTYSTELAKVKAWKGHVCEGLPHRVTQIERGHKISGRCHGFEFFLASCSLPEISQDIV